MIKLLTTVLVIPLLISIKTAFFNQPLKTQPRNQKTTVSPTIKPSTVPSTYDRQKQKEVSISLSLKNIARQNFTLSIVNQSTNEARFDAADLFVNFPKEIAESIKIEDGQSLQLCPGKQIKAGYISVTCVNKPERENALTDKELVNINFNLKQNFKPGSISMDKQKTHFYYNGVEVPFGLKEEKVDIGY
ncbi:hypothetical protein GYA28_03135 [Candidatus Roizmanbacteria bacterium]|jgi:hypothetical protein|nr:hypothetical protein [Candidatus Roizmanbacteria bacterium]